MLATVNEKKIGAQIYAFLLLIVAALRYGFGADYFSYRSVYTFTYDTVIREMTLGSYHAQEIGYRFIVAVFKQLGLSYQVLLVFLAIINLFFCIKYV